MLSTMIVILLLAGVAAAFAGEGAAPRLIAAVALAADLLIAVSFWISGMEPTAVAGQGAWLAAEHAQWIPRFGISWTLALDGLSLLMVVLTLALGLIGVGASWTEIDKRVAFFHFNLLWTLAGVLGVFMALDLFLLLQ